MHMTTKEANANSAIKAAIEKANARKLVIDNFAGGGGASTGIAWAIGRTPRPAMREPCPCCGTPAFPTAIFCGPGCSEIYADWLMHMLLEGQED